MLLLNLRSEYPHLAGLNREFRRTVRNKSDLVCERESRWGSPRGRAAPRPDARDGTSTRWSGSGPDSQNQESESGKANTSPVRIRVWEDQISANSSSKDWAPPGPGLVSFGTIATFPRLNPKY